MTKIMLITLGTGRGIENGIAKSIQVNNPDKLYFIATNESIATVEKVEAALGQKLTYEQPPYLLANADRRAHEGKYDDAVARLYRAVELVAQMLLAQCNIETSRVSIEDLPIDWQKDYKGSNELIKLGQEKAFSLLESMGEEIGREYRKNKNLRNYLSKRNNSILAHQLEPMTRQIYDELSHEANQLAGRAFPGLRSLKDKSQFPILELT